MKNVLLTISAFLLLAGCAADNKKAGEKGENNDSADFSAAYAPWPSDSMIVDSDEVRPWEEIPSDEEAQPIDFEKWLVVMNHIKQNHWARPTAKMLAEVGLEVLYETDETDDSGIKSVHFMYGRQTKCLTDSAGRKYHVPDGSHAVLFEVSAYTSSGAEICFHNPADLRDFMEQAVRRGVVESPNGSLMVCDKPIGAGIHKLKKEYGHDEGNKGEYAELYFLNPEYIPGAEWQVCYVTLDFLRNRIDVE